MEMLSGKEVQEGEGLNLDLDTTTRVKSESQSKSGSSMVQEGRGDCDRGERGGIIGTAIGHVWQMFADQTTTRTTTRHDNPTGPSLPPRPKCLTPQLY